MASDANPSGALMFLISVLLLHETRGKSMAALRAVAALSLVSLCIVGCSTTAELPTSARVVLLDTEFLETPVVESAQLVFKPIGLAALEDGSEVVAFRLVVFASDGEMHADIRETGSLDRKRLTRGAGEVADLTVAQLVGRHAASIGAGFGVFWVEPGSQADRWTVTVALPRSAMAAFTKLQLSTEATADVLVGGITIELVDGFYYVAVVGDSIQWGNGLDEDNKMSSRVSREIESQLGLKVVMQRYAHSGATIAEDENDEGVCTYNCFGGVPKVATAIPNQVNQIVQPDAIDLVLMDGCINDVGVSSIIDPLLAPEDIIEKTELACGDAMTELLHEVVDKMPDARVVVTGYFPIISRESDVDGLIVWGQTQGMSLEGIGDVLPERLSQNSLAFWEAAHDSLREAVAVVNEGQGDDARVVFADPGFTVENALFTEQSLLWGFAAEGEVLDGISLGFEIDLFPYDEALSIRRDRCMDWSDTVLETVFCLYASVGHPNVEGAGMYADAVVDQLVSIGILPDATP